MQTIGLKNTKQRSVILNELRKLKTHPTVEELYEIVKTKHKSMGMCTLYRNLEKFCEEGLVGKINSNPTRYDGHIEAHHHIKCVVCGKVADIFTNIDINEAEVKKLGYKLHGYRIELNGVCEKCNKKGGTKKCQN